MMPFSEMQTNGQPAPDQIEVCVFGPNYGECIVLHLGNGNWVVVDSCLYNREPVAIAYLQALGLDPAQSIKAVIATHWHDDHFKGLSQLLACAPDAQIWISSLLTDKEFFRFAMRVNKNKNAVAGHKLGEFLKIIEDIRRRRSAGQLTFGYANARTVIFRLDRSASGHSYPCEIMAMSPSHGDMSEFLERIAAITPGVRQTKRATPSPSPNQASVALLISIGPLGIVLGADVENSGRLTAGWEAIIGAHKHQPFGPRASLHKASHHGSENAHNREVWDNLLTPNPLAVLTPWRKGAGRLPSAEGARNILQLSHDAFITALDARSQTRRDGRPVGVQRFIREHRGIRLRTLAAPFGAVRFRTDDISTAAWNCELFGAASHLRKLIAAQPAR
jgi:Metallo-beta-lactamase superfamily